MHAFGVEDKCFDFGFGAIGGDFLAIPKEGDAGGVADARDNFAAGADRRVCGGDQSFFAYGLAVGLNGDPGILRGADD